MGPIEDLGKAINGIAEGAGRSTVGIGNRWRGIAVGIHNKFLDR